MSGNDIYLNKKYLYFEKYRNIFCCIYLFIPVNYKEYKGDILQSEIFNGNLDYLRNLGECWKKEYSNVEFSNIHLTEKLYNSTDDNEDK